MTHHQTIFLKNDNLEWTELEGGLKRKILGYNDDLMMVKIFFPKGSVGAAHSHSQTTYVASGKFEVTIDGKQEILKEGDSFFVQPDMIHGVLNLEPGILIDCFSPKRDDFLK